MLSSPRLFGSSAQLLRPSSGLNRAQWRSLQRQWQRQCSRSHGSHRRQHHVHAYQPLRTQRRYQSTSEQAKQQAELAAQQAKHSAEKLGQQAQQSAESTAQHARHGGENAAEHATRSSAPSDGQQAKETAEAAAQQARQTAESAAQRTKQTAESTAQQARQAAESAGTQAKQTATNAAVGAGNAGSRFIAYVYGTGLVLLLGFGYLYVTDTRASLHQYLVVPLIRLVYSDAEDAHHAGVRYIKGLYDFNLHIRERGDIDNILGDLKIDVFGHLLDNPIGTSAGIDKDAEIPSALFALGPAIVEVGGATPLPQEGNPKPRVFRIPSQNALINRYGLNSKGAEHVAMQLRERVRQYAYENGLGLEAESERMILDGEAGVPPGSLIPGKLLAVQVAKNKTTPDGDIAAIARDYVFGVEHLAKYADILVVNVSSPNTPGLRDLQATKPLTAILSAVVASAKSIDRKTKPAVMVKVSPDEDSDAQVEGICAAVWASGVDGVIVGNTTKKRPDTIPKGYVMPADDIKTLTEVGGYSGPQMFQRTLNLVKRYRAKLDQGPQEAAATQKFVQSPLEPTESKSPEHIDETVKQDQQRLKPLTSEAEEASKRPLIDFPERHTSEQPEKAPGVGQAPAPASTASNVPQDAPREGKASSPREAAEGAVQKVISVTQSAVDAGKENLQSARESSGTTAESLTDKVSSAVSSAVDTAKKQINSVTASPKATAEQAVQKTSEAAQSAATATKEKAKEIASSPHTEPVPKVTPGGPPAEKVIFATGGITNGEQCLDILNAGASVCQVYTAMMYGGVGTITRMKSEMREAIKRPSEPRA